MPGDKGVDYIVAVNVGTEGTPDYQAVGGQRDGSLTRDGEVIDMTSKDSGGWEENLPGLKSWGLESEGLYLESDAAWGELEDAWRNGNQVQARLELPSGKKLQGTCTIENLPIDSMPYDGEVEGSVTLSGDGPLEEIAA